MNRRFISALPIPRSLCSAPWITFARIRSFPRSATLPCPFTERLCGEARSGALLFSDSMPWKERRLYLPKPCITARQKQELPPRLRKTMKRLAWIPVERFGEFAASVDGQGIYIPEENAGFGPKDEVVKVNLSGELPLPYQIGVYHFAEDAGLYFIAGCESRETERCLDTLLGALGLSGIGGKTSVGYGRFRLEEKAVLHESERPEHQWLNAALRRTDAKHVLLLTSALPKEEELDEVLADATYQLIRRGGFAHAPGEDALKKQTQYFLCAGAVLSKPFHGALYEVGGTEGHGVYRYGIPICLGVEL